MNPNPFAGTRQGSAAWLPQPASENLRTARDHFHGILKSHVEADYAYYGLAILDSITGQAEECLEHLSRSIELNAQNRIQARSDSDPRISHFGTPQRFR